MRFQPPGPGLLPSGIGRPAELVVPLSNRRSDPRVTSANAGAALERRVKPRCVVYHATAASTSLTIYRTLPVVAGMLASQGSVSQDDADVTAGLSRRSRLRPTAGNGSVEPYSLSSRVSESLS